MPRRFLVYAKPYYERVKLAGSASLLENPIKFERKTSALKPNYEAIGNYVRQPWVQSLDKI